MMKYAVGWALIMFTVALLMIECNTEQAKALDSKAGFLKPAGSLKYTYQPGVILPLHNGKILALGGVSFNDDHPATLIEAEDGKRYGHETGMTELFDPHTGKTQVLTKMPFSFAVSSESGLRQMRAVELNDGRIFMVGHFLPNPLSVNTRHVANYLPFTSKTSSVNLESIAPSTAPQLFGLLYDWQKHTFDIVNAPPEIPPRYLTSLQLLPNGKVLILGGAISSGEETSWQLFPETRVLLFDPVTNSLTEVGNLKHARYGHAVVPITDTEYLLFGGWGPSESEAGEKSCYIYNSDGTCASAFPRRHTSEVELFSLKTGRSEAAGHMLTDRHDFSAAPLNGKTILIHGGGINAGAGYRASELYDIDTGRSRYIGTVKTTIDTRLSRDKSPYLLNGEGVWYRALVSEPIILLAGAANAFIYNKNDFLGEIPLTGQHYTDHLIMPRVDHHLIKTEDGRIFIVGGTASRYTRQASKEIGNAYLIEELIVPASADLKGEK